MAAKLTIVYWRDIPTQVIAQKGRTRHSVPLTDRFLKAVDAAAMLGGDTESDDYMAHWRKETSECDEATMAADANALAEKLEGQFSKEDLRDLIKNKGKKES